MTAEQIRQRIKQLSSRYGQVLNLWPAWARRELQQLQRQLRQLEATEVA